MTLSTARTSELRRLYVGMTTLTNPTTGGDAKLSRQFAAVASSIVGREPGDSARREIIIQFLVVAHVHAAFGRIRVSRKATLVRWITKSVKPTSARWGAVRRRAAHRSTMRRAGYMTSIGY